MVIETSDLEIRREPFARPFAFKGGAFLRAEAGHEAVGLGGLAVLRSDPDVFVAHTALFRPS